MTFQEPEWLPDEGQDSSEDLAAGQPAPPAEPAPEIDPLADLLEPGPRPRIGLILAAIAIVLAVVAALRFLVPGVFVQQGPQAEPAQVTSSFAPTPTTQAEPGALAAPLVDVSPSPEGFDARLAQAASLTNRSKLEEAIALYQDLVNQAPNDARPEMGWAWALLLDGEAEPTLMHALQAVALDPINAEAMATLARAYAAGGDQVHALGMAQNAVQLDPESANAHVALAEAHLLQDQPQQAVKQADMALALDTDNAEAHRIRGRLYVEVDGNLERAISEFQAAADLRPELWIGHYELGMTLLQVKDYKAALLALKTSLGLRRKAATYAAVGEAYYGLEEYDRAQAFLQQALSAGATGANTYALLAAINAELGRCEDAGVFLEQALALDPANGVARQARDSCQGANVVTSAVTSPLPTPSLAGAPATEPPPASPVPVLTGWIAFPVWNAQEGQYDTYVARADGSERHLVAAEMHQPAFSPDGQWLAVNGERSEYLNLSLVRPDGSDLRELTEYIEDGLPGWSPDSRSLTFSSTRHSDRQSRLYVIDTVPFDGQKAPGRTLRTDAYEVLGTYPAWTGDGQIVYSGCDYGQAPVECGLFAIPAGEGPQALRLLTTQPEDTAPAVSGSKIAFMSNRDGNWEIYLVDSKGSGLTRLTDNDVNDGLPTWSPDGRTLAFVSDQGGVWAVWAMDADGANRRKLFDVGGGGLAFDWQNERITWGP
jgi:TolB protein